MLRTKNWMLPTRPGATVENTVEQVENTVEQERQIDARYARLTPSCNHPRNFITIASIVLEICSGKNSRMKINEGQ